MSAITASTVPGFAKQRGVTLVEVLVTLAVVGIGLLGALALQMSAVNANQQAVLRSQALVLTQSLAERMRTNRSLVNDAAQANPYSQLGNYSCPTDPTAAGGFSPLDATNCGAASCTATEIALIDTQQLACQAEAIHPDLRIAVECSQPDTGSGETAFDAPTCPAFALYRISASWPNDIWQTPQDVKAEFQADQRCPTETLFDSTASGERDCVILELQLGVAL